MSLRVSNRDSAPWQVRAVLQRVNHYLRWSENDLWGNRRRWRKDSPHTRTHGHTLGLSSKFDKIERQTDWSIDRLPVNTLYNLTELVSLDEEERRWVGSTSNESVWLMSEINDNTAHCYLLYIRLIRFWWVFFTSLSNTALNLTSPGVVGDTVSSKSNPQKFLNVFHVTLVVPLAAQDTLSTESQRS